MYKILIYDPLLHQSHLDTQWEAMINANLDLTARNIDTQLLSLQEVWSFKILSKSTVKYFNYT